MEIDNTLLSAIVCIHEKVKLTSFTVLRDAYIW